MLQKKYVKFVLPLLLVVVLAGFVVVSRQRSFKELVRAEDHNTAGWKTYRSEYGYEIKYEPTWSIFESPRESHPHLSEVQVIPKTIPYGPSSLIHIEVDDGTLDSFQEEIRSGRRTGEGVTKVQFNGRTALKQQLSVDGIMYVLENRGRLYTIILDPAPEFEITEEQEQAALASFRFTQ